MGEAATMISNDEVMSEDMVPASRLRPKGSFPPESPSFLRRKGEQYHTGTHT